MGTNKNAEMELTQIGIRSVLNRTLLPTRHANHKQGEHKKAQYSLHIRNNARSTQFIVWQTPYPHFLVANVKSQKKIFIICRYYGEIDYLCKTIKRQQQRLSNDCELTKQY